MTLCAKTTSNRTVIIGIFKLTLTEAIVGSLREEESFLWPSTLRNYAVGSSVLPRTQRATSNRPMKA